MGLLAVLGAVGHLLTPSTVQKLAEVPPTHGTDAGGELDIIDHAAVDKLVRHTRGQRELGRVPMQPLDAGQQWCTVWRGWQGRRGPWEVTVRRSAVHTRDRGLVEDQDTFAKVGSGLDGLARAPDAETVSHVRSTIPREQYCALPLGPEIVCIHV